jgi:predicted RNA binding protein YcfA (HicA-like mRNA interferase family)
MMVRIPALKAQDVMRALRRGGFEVVRSSGSHHRLVHASDPNRATTVPVHKGKDLPRPLVCAIIKQAGFTTDEFMELL